MNSEHKRPTQVSRILKYLEDFGSITSYEALMDLGVFRLASRISEIKASGIEIDDEFVFVKNRYGEKCHIKKYYFKKTLDKSV